MSYSGERSNDINEAQRNIGYYQGEISGKEAEKAAIQEKIDRLAAVRDSIAIYKQNVQSERNLITSYKTSVSELNDWIGDHHDDLLTAYSDGLIADYRTYYYQIDDIHDALNSEIARLQNSIYEMDGIIGSLYGLLNNWWTWLNNLIN